MPGQHRSEPRRLSADDRSPSSISEPLSSGIPVARSPGVRRRLLIAALVVVPAVAACSSGNATPTPAASGGSPTSTASAPAESPSATAAATASPGATSTAAATATLVPVDTKPPVALIGPCTAANLHATIVEDSGGFWQGAAGSRLATFRITNKGKTPCTVRVMSRPQLQNGNGTTLINGAAPTTKSVLTVAVGGSLTTMIQTSNLCKAPAIVAPVRVAFVLDTGTVVASPASATDTGGVPPCNGEPGVASGSISMQQWHA